MRATRQQSTKRFRLSMLSIDGCEVSHLHEMEAIKCDFHDYHTEKGVQSLVVRSLLFVVCVYDGHTHKPLVHSCCYIAVILF